MNTQGSTFFESLRAWSKIMRGCLPKLQTVLTTFLILVLLAAVTGNCAAMDISDTISYGAQLDTIAFDGFAMITGNLDAQSFFPPGKVADYFGFQYLRDNAPNGIGHNTSFLTNCVTNVLCILTSQQVAKLIALAQQQVAMINLYAYERFPLMEAFRIEMQGNLPAGASRLDPNAVQNASASLYALDGQLSFDRAVVYSSIINSLNSSQTTYLNTMKSGGYSSWVVTPAKTAAVQKLLQGTSNDVCVAVMGYAGDLFSWYAGSVAADVYFCPERVADYFGSFYVKDAPAVGNATYQISTAMTGDGGAEFLNILTASQKALVTNLVTQQKDNLYAGSTNVIQVRTDISKLLRSLLADASSSHQALVRSKVIALSKTYGVLDGNIAYDYAVVFAGVSKSLNTAQQTRLTQLRETFLSGTYNGKKFDFSIATAPYLYSAVTTNELIEPYISNVNYLFGVK